MEDLKQADELGNSNSQEDENFDWLTDPAVILHDQAAVAAYFNKFDELVVKQRDTLGCEATIYIAPENVERFLRGLGEQVLYQPPRSCGWSTENRPHEAQRQRSATPFCAASDLHDR